MELQELVTRARIQFSGAEKRRQVFELLNGKRSVSEIARSTNRTQQSIFNDLQKLKDFALVFPKKKSDGSVYKIQGTIVYERDPLLRHLPKSYFNDPTKTVRLKAKAVKIQKSHKTVRSISLPSSQEILDICKNGEDQGYEFKEAGVEMNKISKELCAFANTKDGGILLYGVADDGTISGSDLNRQKFDQSLQNSIRNTISPSLNLKIVERDVLGYGVIIVAVDPWNRKEVYQHDGRILIRRGTNVFAAKPDEVRKLHRGEFVI